MASLGRWGRPPFLVPHVLQKLADGEQKSTIIALQRVTDFVSVQTFHSIPEVSEVAFKHTLFPLLVISF